MSRSIHFFDITSHLAALGTSVVMSSFAAPACYAFARAFSCRARVAPRHVARRVGHAPLRFPSAPKLWTVTCSSADDRFSFLRPGDLDGRNRGDISIGCEVDIVLKADQGTGRVTRGLVREFLTNSKFHPQGIKVRLVDGGIGRVERIVQGDDNGESNNVGNNSETGTYHTTQQKQSSDANARERGTKELSNDSNNSSQKQSAKPKQKKQKSSETSSLLSTVYLSNIPKALSKADVNWLVEEIPGVTGLRLPKRGGKNMGYSFITCESETSASVVIATLNGMELEGKPLVAERAKTKTRDTEEEKTPGKTSKSAATAQGKGRPETSDSSGDKKPKKKKGKQWKQETCNVDEDEDPTEKVDPILVARAEMEAEAILEMERARRAARKQMELAEAVAAERREKEAAAERRTTAMLSERAARAEAAAKAAQTKRDREEAVRQEAIALGPVVVDPNWETELLELAEELAQLRASVE